MGVKKELPRGLDRFHCKGCWIHKEGIMWDFTTCYMGGHACINGRIKPREIKEYQKCQKIKI